MSNCFPVIHAEQPDGTWIATCEDVPGWLCFGESLEETKGWAEWSLRARVVDDVTLVHYERPNELRSAA